MSAHGPGRRNPYTTIGISRVPCIRCGEPSRTQFQICADGRLYRPFCAGCDVELNEMVIRWIWGDAREDDLRRYREMMEA